MKSLSLTFVITIFLGLLSACSSHKIKVDDRIELLCSQKWTIVNVKGGKNDFEIGEQFSFTRDSKFIISKNNYTSTGGTWKLYDNTLMLVFNTDQYGNNRKIPSEHKLVRLKEADMILKYERQEGATQTKAKLYLK